jgi:phosphoserine phosphatase
MDIVLTLVVNPTQTELLVIAQNLIKQMPDINRLSITQLNDGSAIDLCFSHNDLTALTKQIRTPLNAIEGLDWCIQLHGPDRRKSMLIADMDSTMITVECIDELADFVGVKDKVSTITEAAMRGELDFEAALKERVALLEGLTEADLHICYNERVTIMSGAKTLVRTMVKNGAYAALVSGGFTYFTDKVANEVGFAIHRANQLEIKEGCLTGKVIEPICGAETKLEALHEFCGTQGLSSKQVLAVGDGANDIPMLKAAGLGTAYHAKPKTAAAAHAAIRNGDLSTLLYFQGYHVSEFESA